MNVNLKVYCPCLIHSGKKLVMAAFVAMAVFEFVIAAYIVYGQNRERKTLEVLQNLDTAKIKMGYVCLYGHPGRRRELDIDTIGELTTSLSDIRAFSPEHPVFDVDSWIVVLVLTNGDEIQMQLYTKGKATNVWGKVIQSYSSPESVPNATTVLAWFQSDRMKRWLATVTGQ